MSAVVPLQAGEKLKQGDLMQKYDGKLYPVVDWQGRTAQGALYYREYTDIVPMGSCCCVATCRLCGKQEFRLARLSDIGRNAIVSDIPLDNTQIAVNWDNRPRSRLIDVNFGATLPYKAKASGLRFRFAWVPVE